MKGVQKIKEVSERRAYQVLGQPQSSQRYPAREPGDEEKRLVERMHELVRQHPRYGFRRIHAVLIREGWRVNRKRVHRLWRREGFKVPEKQRKKRRLGMSANSCVRRRAEHTDRVWALDFIHDRTAGGAAVKFLGIVDEYTRECLALEAHRSITSESVQDVLVGLFVTRGLPGHIRCDNGPEFIAEAFRTYLEHAGLEPPCIAPGAPWENGYAESFCSRLRDELLNREQFETRSEARWFARSWKEESNQERPHSALGYLTPAEFSRRCAAAS